MDCRDYYFWLVFHVLTFFSVTSQNEMGNEYLSSFLELVNNRSTYDKNFFPPTEAGTPIRINVSMIVYDVRDITFQSFRVDIYFTQVWNDRRLFIKEKYTDYGWSVVQPETINLMWHPDTFFPNSLDSLSTLPGDESFTHKTILKVNGKGDVFYRQRLSITAICKMNLQRYPFDYQLCKLALRSYGLARDILIYKWDVTAPLVFVKELTLPDLNLFNSTTDEFIIDLSNDIFLGLNACFMFERKTNYYFMELYIPASMIVVVAWLSSLTGEYRFYNLLTVLLAQLFLYFSYITVMPRVSDVKALDIFLVACFIFIFAALVKTFFVNDHKPLDDQKDKVSVIRPFSAESQKYVPVYYIKKFCALFSRPSHHYCQGTNFILFTSYPLLFVIFSIAYYVIYMYVIHDQSQMDLCNT